DLGDYICGKIRLVIGLLDDRQEAPVDPVSDRIPDLAFFLAQQRIEIIEIGARRARHGVLLGVAGCVVMDGVGQIPPQYRLAAPACSTRRGSLAKTFEA